MVRYKKVFFFFTVSKILILIIISASPPSPHSDILLILISCQPWLKLRFPFFSAMHCFLHVLLAHDFPKLWPLASAATTHLAAGHHTYRKCSHRTWFVPQNIENIIHVPVLDKQIFQWPKKSVHLHKAFAASAQRSCSSSNLCFCKFTLCL